MYTLATLSLAAAAAAAGSQAAAAADLMSADQRAWLVGVGRGEGVGGFP